MSNKKRKRIVNQLFHGRFHSSSSFWQSVEDRAWENMAPVGWEFGSPDYERLQILDLYAAGRMTSDDAMGQLGVDSLDILHQRVLAAGLAVPRTDAVAPVKGPVQQKLP